MNARRFVLFVLFALTTLIQFGLAQDNASCFECHDDPDPEFTMQRSGKAVRLYVDPKLFEHSGHRSLECVACHVNFDPDADPHAAVLQPKACADCHSKINRIFRQSAHTAELSCRSCHSNVHKPEKSTLAKLKQCESCHKAATADFAESIHAASKAGVTCLGCHDSHATAIAGSASCLSCHADSVYVSKHIGGESITAMLEFESSIHSEYTDCSDCHGSHRILALDAEASPVNRQNVLNACNACHSEIVAEYRDSEHFKAMENSAANAPGCTDCHGEHDIHAAGEERLLVNREREVAICMSCHYDSPEVKALMTHDAGFIAGFEESIHGKAFKGGNTEAAICSDCHGAHSVMRASDAGSHVNKFNIAATCGTCHNEVATAFAGSVHGQSLQQGVADAPTCTDCHGEHNIIAAADAASPTAPRNVPTEVCGPCHNSVKLATKFGLPARNYTAYLDSYHGLAVRSGGSEAANCASCHGVHDILPSSDPASSIHPDNLVQTCGSCHPGINSNATIGKIHLSEGDGNGHPLLYWIPIIYIALIVVTIGLMGLHNLLDWFRKTKNRYARQHTPDFQTDHREEEAKKGIEYLRMSLNERIQHGLLASSFMLLVITGFMLKFPDSWWVQGIRQLGGESLFGLRGLLHRSAAIVMTLSSLYHLYYIGFNPRGRQLIKDLMFRWQDFREMRQMLAYNLGLSTKKPRFDRFNYIEKSEYWALIWGTVVMTLTGFALWFENQTMTWFSKLFVDVAEVIHYYEAWLAFLAIVVWHFYYVIFNPDVYPINLTWLTGKVTEKQMEEEYPLELERIKQAESRKDGD